MKPCGFSEQLLDAWEGSENTDRLGLSPPALLRQTRQSIDDFLLLPFSLLHFVVQPAKLTSPPPPPPPASQALTLQIFPTMPAFLLCFPNGLVRSDAWADTIRV